MIARFLQTASQEVAKGTGNSIAKRFFNASLLFWSASFLFLDWAYSWKVSTFLTGTTGTLQFLVAFIFFVLIMFSEILMEWTTLPILRWLEGYGMTLNRTRKIRKLKKYLREKEKALFDLDKSIERELSSSSQGGEIVTSIEEKKRKKIKLETELYHYPSDHQRLMPTRLGNILRAAEAHSLERYGLDSSIVWPRFWLILPDEAKNELSIVQEQLEQTTRFFTWSILFSIWTGFGFMASRAYLAIFFSIIGAIVTSSRLLFVARIYGDLIRSVFDLYRFALYEQLRFPLPHNGGEEEREIGKRLTQYLYRGISGVPNAEIFFKHETD